MQTHFVNSMQQLFRKYCFGQGSGPIFPSVRAERLILCLLFYEGMQDANLLRTTRSYFAKERIATPFFFFFHDRLSSHSVFRTAYLHHEKNFKETCCTISMRNVGIQRHHVSRFQRLRCRSSAAVHMFSSGRDSHLSYAHPPYLRYGTHISRKVYPLLLLLTAGLLPTATPPSWLFCSPPSAAPSAFSSSFGSSKPKHPPQWEI